MPQEISIRIEFYNGIVGVVPCHSVAFLYTSATVQMLKLHNTLIFTAVTHIPYISRN